MKRLFLCLLLTLAVTSSAAVATQVDTSRTRVPQRPERSLGSKLLAIPSFVLNSPFLVTKGVARGLVYVGYDSPFGRQITARVSAARAPVHPVFGGVRNGGFGGGLGLAVDGPLGPRDRIVASATLTVLDYQSHQAGYRIDSLFASPLRFRFDATYDLKTREPFYGLGNSTRTIDRVAYTLERTSFQSAFDWQFDKNVNLEIAAGYYMGNTYDGRDDNEEGDLDVIRDTLGLTDDAFAQSRLVDLSLTVRRDTRDMRGRPQRGYLTEFTVGHAFGVGRTRDIGYYHYTYDARLYLHLFKHRVLEARFRTQFATRSDRDNGHRIPVYLLPELGGSDGLRGYRVGRFTDHNLMLASLEYRWPVWKAIDAFLFFEEGRVFAEYLRDELSFKNWHYSIGTGFRLWKPAGEIVRVEFAWSREDFRFYVKVGDL